MNKFILQAFALGLLVCNAFSFERAGFLPASQPFSKCDVYHVNRATWYKQVEIEGEIHKLELIGRCLQGHKNENFQLNIDYYLSGKSKYCLRLRPVRKAL